jgi:hypothetical protein
MHMHPESYIEMIDQDRERAMARRALQRSAREGGAQQPGQARGGIIGLATQLRSVAVAALNGRTGHSNGTSSPALPSGA